MGQQWDVVHIRRRRDRQIDCASARLTTSCLDGRGETAPLAGDLGSQRKRIERRFDRRESLYASRAFVLISRDEDAEVELGQGCNAYRGLDVERWLIADEYRRIEQRPHGLGERIVEPSGELLEGDGEGLGRGGLPNATQGGTRNPVLSAHRSEAGDWPAGDRDRDLLTGLGLAKNLTDVVP